jgi:hypothetical protein
MQQSHNLFLIVEVPCLNTSRRRHLLPPAQQADRFVTAVSADFNVGFKRRAHSRSIGLAENVAQILRRELYATFSGGFAIGHAWNRRTDGRGHATGATAFTAFHDGKLLAAGDLLKDGAQNNRCERQFK